MAALVTSWLVAGASAARAQVTAEPSAVVFPDPAKFAHGLYTEGEVGAVAFFGKAGDAVSPGFAIGARVGYDLFRWFALQAHFVGSTHQISGDNPLNGQLLQTYQALVEGKLTYRFGQTSIFGEGGVGVERLSTNALYALGIEPQYRVGFVAGGGARARLPLPVASLLGRRARRLLRHGGAHQQPGADGDHLPEVHVLSFRAGRLLLVAVASLLGAALGCQTVDLGAPPADVNLCEPSQQFFIDSIWPMFLGNTYNQKHCYDSGCHGSGSTTAMTLTNPIEAGTIPLPPIGPPTTRRPPTG